MYWDEKIDWLKKELPSEDFKVPYSYWQTIFNKIEVNFIQWNINLKFKNWTENIKDKRLLARTAIGQLSNLLDKLDPDVNCWMIISFGDQPTAMQLIYECKPYIVMRLAGMAGCDFFVVDKKYSWFTWFQIDKDKKELCIYKSGDKLTPFEK